MKNLATAILLLMVFGACNKNDSANRITPPGGGGNPPFSGTLISNVVYGSNVNWLGQTEQLAMDIYIPEATNTSPAKYPLVLSIHGGGFHKGDKTDNAAYYTSLASSGFVVAAINYRIGWTQDSVNLCDGDSLEAAEAVYRALQDARASLRFITAHADDYKIDTNWMFISGSSAGALTALYTAYADQKDMDTYFPGISDILGPIDADNALKNTYSLKAVVSMWGALASPYIISAADAKPTIFFQGLGDSVVPCGIGNYYNCPNLGTGYGSIPLYQRLQSLNVPAIAHIDPAGDHGVYTEDYRTPNIVCFLNDVMAGDVKSMYDTKQSSNCN